MKTTPNMKVYISGPMTGIEGFNHKAFRAAADEIRAVNCIPLSPADVLNGETHHPRERYMREGIKLMLDADAIYFLPGWQASRGARVEAIIAQEIGLEVLTSL